MDWHEVDDPSAIESYTEATTPHPPTDVLELEVPVPTQWSGLCYMIERCATITLLWDPFCVEYSLLFGIALVFNCPILPFRLLALWPHIYDYS